MDVMLFGFHRNKLGRRLIPFHPKPRGIRPVGELILDCSFVYQDDAKELGENFQGSGRICFLQGRRLSSPG